MSAVFVSMVIGFVIGVVLVQEVQKEESEYMAVEEFETWGYDREVSK
jgi:hypothetical protein